MTKYFCCLATITARYSSNDGILSGSIRRDLISSSLVVRLLVILWHAGYDAENFVALDILISVKPYSVSSQSIRN